MKIIILFFYSKHLNKNPSQKRNIQNIALFMFYSMFLYLFNKLNFLIFVLTK